MRVVERMWSTGDIFDTSPGFKVDMDYVDGITDAVYRGHLRYIPGFHRWIWIMRVIERMW